nr:Chain E, BISUBSTRATE INHIBITOR [synthetic construct]1RQQ_F Chain F, BISUBSTRATE INHIBITOR [synthetic construct]
KKKLPATGDFMNMSPVGD